MPYNILSTTAKHNGTNNKSIMDGSVIIKISRTACPYDSTECPLLEFIAMESGGNLYLPFRCPQIFPTYKLKITPRYYKYKFELRNLTKSEANEKAQQLTGYIWNHCKICQQIWYKQIKNIMK